MMMIDPTGSITPTGPPLLNTHVNGICVAFTSTAAAATAQPPSWQSMNHLGDILSSYIHKKRRTQSWYTHTHVICLFLSFVSRFACVAIIHPSIQSGNVSNNISGTLLSFSLSLHTTAQSQQSSSCIRDCFQMFGWLLLCSASCCK